MLQPLETFLWVLMLLMILSAPPLTVAVHPPPMMGSGTPLPLGRCKSTTGSHRIWVCLWWRRQPPSSTTTTAQRLQRSTPTVSLDSQQSPPPPPPPACIGFEGGSTPALGAGVGVIPLSSYFENKKSDLDGVFAELQVKV
ncbi:unnamed protein product [Cuscuta epithymum]|uniref:Uncharacterized protein n=1 Tax=Cuscuta epithymum TaxID=186058 RepID=A0AAV0G3Z3_9ASTE|nr:unnamed protein product [Cuscuta epithymum]